MSTFVAKATLAEKAATAYAITHREEPSYTKLYWAIANKIGISQALLIQIVEGWCQTNRRSDKRGYFHYNEWWTAATYKEWKERYPAFGCIRSIQQMFLKLEKQGYIISCQPGKKSGNLTKYYRVDSIKIGKLLSESSSVVQGLDDENDTIIPRVQDLHDENDTEPYLAQNLRGMTQNLRGMTQNLRVTSSESLTQSELQPPNNINKIRSIHTIQEQSVPGLCVCGKILLEEEKQEEDSKRKIDEITKPIEVSHDSSFSVKQNQNLGNSEISSPGNNIPRRAVEVAESDAHSDPTCQSQKPIKVKSSESSKKPNYLPDWFPGDEHEYKQFVKYKGNELLQNPPMNIRVDAVNSRAVAINILNANAVVSLALYEGWKDSGCPSEPPPAATPLNAQNNGSNYKVVTPGRPEYEFDSLNQQVHATYYQEFLEKGEVAFTTTERNAAWLQWAKAKHPERFTPEKLAMCELINKN